MDLSRTPVPGRWLVLVDNSDGGALRNTLISLFLTLLWLQPSSFLQTPLVPQHSPRSTPFLLPRTSSLLPASAASRQGLAVSFASQTPSLQHTSAQGSTLFIQTSFNNPRKSRWFFNNREKVGGRHQRNSVGFLNSGFVYSFLFFC